MTPSLVLDSRGALARPSSFGASPVAQWTRLSVAIVTVAWLAAPFAGFMSSLGILTALGFAGAFFGFSRPALGVLSVTLLCTLDPLSRHFLLTTGGLLRWNTFNYWLLMIMAVSPLFVWRVSDAHSKILKGFVFLLLLETTVSPAYEYGIQHTIGVLTLFGLLVYFAQAEDDPELWYGVAVLNGLTGALGGLMYYLLRDSLPAINPNAWAFFPETAMFGICLGFRAAAARPHGQLVLSVFAVTNLLWVFLTGSRGGLVIALVAMLFISLTIRRARHRFGFVVAAVALAIAMSSMFGDLEDTAMRRLGKMFDEEQSAAARTNGRSDLALAGWHMVKHNPLGVGTGGFAPTWAELGYVPGLSGFKRGQEFQAHSGWIKVLAENGWPGAVLLVMFVGSFAVAGWRRGGPFIGLGLLVSASLGVAFLSTEFQGKGFWMLAAAAMAQLHPEHMRHALAVETQRFGYRPRRIARAGEPATAGPVE